MKYSPSENNCKFLRCFAATICGVSLQLFVVYYFAHNHCEKVFVKEKQIKTLQAKLKRKGLQWSNKAPNYMTWRKAVNYCKNLNEGGYSDWRLPNIDELRTLIQNCPATVTGGECGVTDSCLSWDECRNDACYGCKSDSTGKYSKLGDTDCFWSSSTRSADTDLAWRVYFSLGGVNDYDKNDGCNVRCVR